MLQSLLGSTGSERVLVFIAARGQGYVREISRFSDMGLHPIQRQLDKLQIGGILVSQTQGRTRLYSFNRESKAAGNAKAFKIFVEKQAEL